MPTFNAYPASQVRAPDVWGAMQKGAEGAQMNQLRQMQMEQAQTDRQTQGQEKQRARALEQMGQVADLLTPFADPNVPGVQKAQMWPQMLQRAQQMGLPVDKAPQQYDPQWVAMTMAQAGKYQTEAKADTISSEAEAQKIRIAQGSRAPVKEVPQYGTPKWDSKVGKFYQTDPKTNERKYITPKSGMSLTVGEDGTVTFTQGAAGMEKKTRAAIEKSLVNAKEGLVRLKDIQSKFKPAFQEIPTRIGVAWTGLKARFGDGDITPEDSQALVEFADYRRTALSNINLYIKEITGAQMSVQEAARIRKALPDPGEGIFGGDDPITFKANMDSVMRDLEKAVVRFNYYLSRGITDDKEIARLTSLDSIKIAVNKDGERRADIDGQWVPIQ